MKKDSEKRTSRYRQHQTYTERKLEKPAPRKRKRIAAPVTSLPWGSYTDFADPICFAMLQRMFEKLPFTLSEPQIKFLVDYLLLVREQNQEINLVSRLHLNVTLLSSLYESIAFLDDPRFTEKSLTVLDLGTGGGFPGIPYAALRPQDQVTLLDSRRVKTLALKRILSELPFTNLRILHDRAETLPEHDEIRYDVITVRAVGPLKEFLPWTRPLLAEKGAVITWKGPEGAKEYETMKDEWSIDRRVQILPHRGVIFLSPREENGK